MDHMPEALETWSVRIILADGATVERVREAITPHSRRIALVALTSDDDVRLTFAVEIPRRFDIAALTEGLRAAGARSVTWLESFVRVRRNNRLARS